MTETAAPLIVIVDDEAPIRQMQRRILTGAGYRVVDAPDAAEAFAMLESLRPDLLIADLNMPEIPGEEMVRRIHAERPNLKVLYVTGHIDRLLNVRSLIWDGEAFLDKPFTAAGLLEAVGLLLTGRVTKQAPAHTGEPV